MSLDLRARNHPEAQHWEDLLRGEELGEIPEQVEYMHGMSLTLFPEQLERVSENFPWPHAPDYHRLQSAWDVVRYLPVQDQQILWLSLREHQSQQQIADFLDLSQPTIHYRLHRSYERLQQVATMGLPAYRDTVRELLTNPPTYRGKPVGHHILTYGYYWAIANASRALGIPPSTMQPRIRTYRDMLTGPVQEWVQVMIESPLTRIKTHPTAITEAEWHQVGVSLYNPDVDATEIQQDLRYDPTNPTFPTLTRQE